MGRSLATGLLVVLMLAPAVAVADQPGAFRGDVSAFGMGNTGVAVPERGCLWIYNPALLNTIAFDLCIPSVDFGANVKTFELFDFLDKRWEDFRDFDTLPASEQSDLIDDAGEYVRKPLGFRTAPLLGLAARNFGGALYANTRTFVIVRPGRMLPSPQVPEVDGLFQTDVVVQLGTAGLAFHPLSLGISIRYVNRSLKYVADIDPENLDDVVDTLTDDLDHYHGWAVDIGAYYPLGIWNVTLGANFRNILGKIQIPGPDPADPTEDKGSDEFYRNLVVGAAWRPFPRLLLAADIQDLLNQTELAFGDQIQVGAELDMVVPKFRIGMFRGEVTYGIGVNLFLFKIDFATYQPIYDFASLTDEEERVYVGQVKFGW